MSKSERISEVDRIKSFFKAKPGYLKKGNKVVAHILKTTEKAVIEAKKALKTPYKVEIVKFPSKKFENLVKKDKIVFTNSYRNKYNPDNVLFIPDLHAPFIKEGALDWILSIQKKYNCGNIIFAGDIVDGHAWSYHEHDVDGMSVGDELEAAKIQLKDWYQAFPQAICLLGNHDMLIQRKARTAGLSKQFIRDFGSVINAPEGWEFKLEHIIDNVLYHHGSVGDAFTVAKNRRISTCQGHFHAKTFVQWSVSEVDSIFGLQIGWAADRDKYAFDYGKSFTSKPILSCGIILDNGRTPIVELMPL